MTVDLVAILGAAASAGDEEAERFLANRRPRRLIERADGEMVYEDTGEPARLPCCHGYPPCAACQEDVRMIRRW